jgi:hypothetical protein
VYFKPFQFVNGKLVEEKVVSQMASISAGDVDKLMDMYSTFNHCSNTTSIFTKKST